MGYIYLRTNLINGKKYVGQTTNIKVRNYRWNCLKTEYGGYAINNARAKYGVDGFSFEILRECPNEEMNYWEMYYIKEYNSKKPNGYNSTDGGDSVCEMTDEIKKKISDALKTSEKAKIARAKTAAALRGRKHSPEHIAKVVAARRGMKLSEETKSKIAAAHRGMKLSEETKAKVADALRGRKLSDETRKKMSDALRGRKLSPESIEKIAAAKRGKHYPKISAAQRGRKHSEEAKKKISDAKRGIKLSDETRKKMSEAQRGKAKSPEHVAKVAAANSKPIQGLDKITGEVVFTFPSAAEAERQYGFTAKHIAACCRGERKSHKGFIWRYKCV